MTDEGRPINTFSFSLPRLGYSQALVEIGDDRGWWLWFWNCVKVAGDTRAETFPDESPDPAIRVIDETPPLATAHQTPQGERVNPNPAPPPQQPPARQGAPQNGAGYKMFCPDHTDGGGNRAELRPSGKNKNVDFDEELGKEIPASWYHSLVEGGTHSVWRSGAIMVPDDD